MEDNKSNSFLRRIQILTMVKKKGELYSTSDLLRMIKKLGFSVSLRTVERDLEFCSKAPFLKLRFKKEEGIKDHLWYYEDDAELFNNPEISNISALAFNLVEKFLKTKLPLSAQNILNPFFKLAQNKLKSIEGKTDYKWSEKFHIQPRGQRLLPAEVKSEVLQMVFESVWKEKQFQAMYRRKWEKEAVERVVNPLGLVFQEEVIYLVCTFWKYDKKTDILRLPLHRFETATPLETERIIPKDFDLDEYIAEGHLDILEKKEPIKLKLLLSEGAASHLYETKMSEDQKLIEQKNKQVILEATVAYTSELRWWLLSLGEYVEVLEPKDLREEFGRIVRSMASKYD
jgi:predicted DNA-binding transcriptional regulator YafY